MKPKASDTAKIRISNPLEHYNIEFFLFERPAIFHFVDDRLWFYNKSDKDAGKHGNNRHQNAVADEIREIQKSHTENFNKA